MNEPLEKARELLDEGLPEDALDVLDKVDRRSLEVEDEQELLTLTVEVLLEMGEIDAVWEPLEQALSLGEDVDLRCLESLAHLASGDYQEALHAAEQAVHTDPQDAAAQQALGNALTFLRRLKEADRSFARAAELDPETYFKPFRLSRRNFDKAVEEVLASLPEMFRHHLENVEVAVEDIPSSDLLEDEVSHELLGLYQGKTIHDPEWDFPDLILLFQRNIENVSPDRHTLLREIRDTVLHEVGHHLGLDEDQLRAIEDMGDEG